MSDHSLLGFLERQTKEELKAMLVYCLRDENRASYEDMIGLLQSTLRIREACGACESVIYSSKGDEMGYTERIRALREDRDMTQAEIARLLNIGQKTYSDYELGKTRIPVDSLIVLARLYNVSMAYICGVSDSRKGFPKG